jgi:hypothetical protein
MPSLIDRPRPTGHVKTPAELAIRVRESVARWGLNPIAKACGLDPHTVTRVAAGFDVQACVLDVVREGLDTPEADMAVFFNAHGGRKRR